MSIEHRGGCQCGAIRYEVRGTPRAVTVCHCTDCQQQSGSAFGMSVVVERSDFVLTSGTPRTFTKTAESGRTLECGFCGDCGNRIFHKPELAPDMMNLKAGTLEDTSWLAPAIHVWTSSKQPWVVIPEGPPQFPRNPGD
jgi:hypothetical protein